MAGNDHIFHREVEINRGLLAKAFNQTKELKGLALEALEFQLVASTIANVTKNLIGDVKARIAAINTGAQGILHPLFGQEELIKEALDHAKKVGMNEPLLAVFVTAISLLRAPISLVLGTWGAGVLSHIPMHYETTEPMRLYQMGSARSWSCPSSRLRG